MNTPALFAVAVAIWGTTWFAIKSQLDAMAPEYGVALRFAIAAGLIAAWCGWRGLPMRFSPRTHGWLALQGALGFSAAYLFVYHAERFIVSGLVAVGYAAAPLVNLVLARHFFGSPMSARVALGGLCGLVGIVLVFWPTIEPLASGGGAAPGVTSGALLTIAAVLASCVSNMVALRVQQDGFKGWPPMAIAMAYGAACSLLTGLVLQRPGAIAWSTEFAVSLAYLSVVGSVLAFGAYYTLLGRIGAARASYVGAMTPIVALFVSSWLEGFAWTPLTLAGVALAVAGNVLALQSGRRAPATVESPRESR